MPIVSLSTQFVSSNLACPAGKSRIEYCDKELPGLYIEVRATSPGQGTYYWRYKDAAGKTCHQKIDRTGDITLSDARKRAKQLKAEIHLGADPRGEDRAQRAVPTMSAFFEESYLPHVKARKRSWEGDVSLFRNRVEPEFGKLRLNELKRQKVQQFHAGLLDEGISEATADHYAKLIRQMLNRAVEWEVIEVNPISRFKLFSPDNRKENYLGETDLQALLEVLGTYPNRPVCHVALFLLSTGARLNEAVSARWDQIDRENKIWRIPAKVSKSKRIRPVPLNDSAIEVLDALGTEGKHEELFISDRTGKPLRHIQKIWERVKLEAGLPHLRIHDLRHQFASLLVNAGRSLYEVQKILGHSSHSVTERYAHLDKRSLMDAANSASVKIKEATAARA